MEDSFWGKSFPGLLIGEFRTSASFYLKSRVAWVIRYSFICLSGCSTYRSRYYSGSKLGLFLKTVLNLWTNHAVYSTLKLVLSLGCLLRILALLLTLSSLQDSYLNKPSLIIGINSQESPLKPQSYICAWFPKWVNRQKIAKITVSFRLSFLH